MSLIKLILNNGIFLALIAQLDKLFRHNRQGSYLTRKRYYEGMKRFCAFLALVFHLKKLTNISGKHLVAYVEYMQLSGKSANTIKTELAGIRFWHDKMDAKYRLPSNNQLGIELERRRFGGVDRTWTPPEFNRLLMAALAEDRYDYILAFYLARYPGLRVHECFRIDTAIAEDALRKEAITIKGKGGKVRTVPINEQIAIVLREQLHRTERGHKLLVPDNMPTDDAIYGVQKFLLDHRKELRDEGDERPLTFHGLRHTYAAEQYQRRVDAGTPELTAHFEVSKLLGHERPDVTDIYLASVRKGGRLGD